MGFAQQAAKRATCKRKKVGCVLVRDNRIISTGYNGSISGTPHCFEADCTIVNDHCVRTIHAEMNALIWAAQDLRGVICYTTCHPCWACLRVLVQAGIGTFYYLEPYGHGEEASLVNNLKEEKNLILTQLEWTWDY
jgi:dCMP deaminase